MFVRILSPLSVDSHLIINLVKMQNCAIYCLDQLSIRPAVI